ncbi:MAG: IS1182 family transposase [Lachnospiraceae bacterium]|nr:IS1182 family transposase [Lachnospiraceae bacterium]
MVEQQQQLVLSPYLEIYELVVPKDNLLRQIKELVDFGFIYDELLDKYCLNNGRNAVPPIRMFKYLLLKSIYDLSDADVVERSKYDMSFKYFLDMAPEDEVINPSSLTKFRKLRLKDMNLLDMLIAKTVQTALDKGIIKPKSIIADATHTKSRYNQRTPRQALQEQSKRLRRVVYETDETMKDRFPDKNTEDSLEKELEYCHALISVIKEKEELCSYPKVKEKLNLLEESVKDDLEHLETSKDVDAKTGHKTADTSFFGYKTHIEMNEERIITAATITSGEKTDGKELPELVRKSREAGMEVKMVIGDKACSGQKNTGAAEKGGYELVSKLNGIITQGNRTKPDEFEFNKDAGMYQCKAGHLAVHKYLDKREKEKKNKNPRMACFFDVEKCKCCPYRNGCYKEGARKKTYSETLKSDAHSKQAEFQETEHFKEKMKERYKIEAKNSELKHRHGYDTASSSGLIGMEMQGAMAIFAVNLKRIIKLISEK